MMVGLGVVLDKTKGSDTDGKISTTNPHVILSKANMIRPSASSQPPPPLSPQPSHRNLPHWKFPSDQVAAAGSGFLDLCFLCQQKLLPGKDIFMYKGDRAFCSEQCRFRQIFMDDDNNLPLAPMKQPPTPSSSSSPSSPNRKRTKNRANGFLY